MACSGEHSSTFSRSLPSLTRSVEPGFERREDLRVRQADAGGVAVGRVEVEAEASRPRSSITGPAAKVPHAELRPLQVGEDADRAAELGLDLADQRVAPGDVVVGAVAHVEPEHVGAGEEQAADHLVGVGGGAERRDDLDVALAAERGHAEAIPIPLWSEPVIAEGPGDGTANAGSRAISVRRGRSPCRSLDGPARERPGRRRACGADDRSGFRPGAPYP